MISEQYSVHTSVEEAANAGQTPLIHVVSGGAASPMAWYPDEDKVVLDVDPLLKDGAAEDVVTRHVAKEVFRAFGFLLGGGFVYYDKSLLAPLRTLKDVDRADIALPMEMRFQQNSPALGISPYRRVLYRKACEEGWAHSPTNKTQQRVWNRVHAMPKNPMKIEFDPKKGR